MTTTMEKKIYTAPMMEVIEMLMNDGVLAGKSIEKDIHGPNEPEAPGLALVDDWEDEEEED